MGINPQNGYIYAVRATQGAPDYDRATWSSYTGHIQILKYGSMGVDNLGPIQVALPLIDVVHNHSITRSSLPGPRASFLRTSLG